MLSVRSAGCALISPVNSSGLEPLLLFSSSRKPHVSKEPSPPRLQSSPRARRGTERCLASGASSFLQSGIAGLPGATVRSRAFEVFPDPREQSPEQPACGQACSEQQVGLQSSWGPSLPQLPSDPLHCFPLLPRCQETLVPKRQQHRWDESIPVPFWPPYGDVATHPSSPGLCKKE